MAFKNLFEMRVRPRLWNAGSAEQAGMEGAARFKIGTWGSFCAMETVYDMRESSCRVEFFFSSQPMDQGSSSRGEAPTDNTNPLRLEDFRPRRR